MSSGRSISGLSPPAGALESKMQSSQVERSDPIHGTPGATYAAAKAERELTPAESANAMIGWDGYQLAGDSDGE